MTLQDETDAALAAERAASENKAEAFQRMANAYAEENVGLRAQIVALTTPPPPETLLALDLSATAVAKATAGTFSGAFGQTTKLFGNDSPLFNTSFGQDTDGTKFIRTTMPPNAIGSASGPSFGVPLSRQVDEATLDMVVRFGAGFDWRRGGKLPGLSGVLDGYAPTFPSGGKADPTNAGWSGRIMWEKLTFPYLEFYMYHFGQKLTTAGVAYGDDVPWAMPALTSNEWVPVRCRYKLNTVGQADGVLEAWVNARQVCSQQNYVFRAREDLHIRHLLWSIFRGGADLKLYGSPQTSTIDIRDGLRVTTPAL